MWRTRYNRELFERSLEDSQTYVDRLRITGSEMQRELWIIIKKNGRVRRPNVRRSDVVNHD